MEFPGTDFDGREYKNATEMWMEEAGDEFKKSEWYRKGITYWQGVEATMDGVLNGYGHINDTDIKTSESFLNSLLTERVGSKRQLVALDCGSGIGRVTKNLLVRYFNEVDLVDPVSRFLESARVNLSSSLDSTLSGAHQVNFYCSSLHDFTPAEGRYDCVWIQWCIGHLPDDDLVSFFKRAKAGLKPGGFFVLKEDIARNGFMLDTEDNLVTRCDQYFRELFSQAGLIVYKMMVQEGFPDDLFPVKMYALVTELPKRSSGSRKESIITHEKVSVEQACLNPMTSSSSGISSEPVTDWATVLSKSKLVHCNGALAFHPHPHDAFGSKKMVQISAEDVSSSTNKWNCALIAQILGDNSSLHEVKKFAESKWNDSGLLEVQKLDNELFIFRFKSKESKNQVLEESLVFYGSKMMYLMPWVPNKPIQKLTLETVPIWIKLPGLGLQYFTLQALSKLGSLIGRPLFADKDTIDQSRLSYARMCVEIIADDEKRPNVIVFINEFGVEIVQDVEYEWVPPRCSFCKLFGHDTNLCTKYNVPDPEAEGKMSTNNVSDPEAEGDSHDDEKSEQLEIDSENEEVDEEASSEDEEIYEDNEILLPKKMRISRNRVCPCGSKKRYKYCCESVADRSSCDNQGESQDKPSLLPEDKKISRNETCPCGSEKRYKRCCGSTAGRSSCKEKNKTCPCGSTKKYKKCCGSVDGCQQKNSRNMTCHCGSTKKYQQCCGSVAKDLPPIEEEWVFCT